MIATRSKPLTFAVFGYGRFGRALSELLIEAGYCVSVFDPHADVPAALVESTAEVAVRDADWIVLAMPVPEMHRALRALRPLLTPRHSVMDVGSVKVHPCAWMNDVLGAEIPHVGTHPLFGPISLARGEQPRRVVLCPHTAHPRAALHARRIFQQLGCEVVERDAAEHDRVMADTHVLAFFIAKALVEMGIGDDLSLAPPSFRGLANMLAAVRGDAGHLFAAIQHENPYAAPSRERFLEALGAVHRRLAERVTAGQLSIPED